MKPIWLHRENWGRKLPLPNECSCCFYCPSRKREDENLLDIVQSISGEKAENDQN